ncbi:MAG: trypsin-like peptidase domain-containing protein [Candidatus Bathyarchaeia archaeon]|jgi:S1-C subfamily serine protease
METPPSPTPHSPAIPSFLQPQKTPKTRRFSVFIVVFLLVVGLVAGGLIGYAVTYSDFNGKLNSIQAQLQGYSQNATYVSYPNATYVIGSNVSLSTLYSQVKSSVVVIQDLVPVTTFFGTGYDEQQGSGFIASVDNQLVIVTNNHVVQDAINETVTFADGDSYPAKVLGSDPLADLAALSITPMPSGLTPLTLVSSSTLQVGEPVVAVGAPYGLSGTLTTGVISALGRTITESSSSGSTGPTIPDIIQTSTAINPGNSGGPLLDYSGEVVGITTAVVSSSQGLVFAIPSDTIIRELSSLVTTGSYNQHPSIDATLTDMNYQIAQAMGTSVTYGSLVESVSTQNGLKGGTTQVSILGSTVTIGGDIIIAVNGVRITNTDDLLSYLEQNTLPGQTANFTVVRNGQTQTVSVTIGNLS